MQHQTIFARKFLRKTMDEQFILEKEVDNLDAKRAVIENWVAQINSGRIDRQKEVATQADFLNKIFGDVLGYTYDTHDKWLLHKEVSTPIGGKSADGALGFFRMTDGKKDLSDVRVAIELKDARTHLDKAQNRQGDKRTPVEQGFDYANKFGENCKWLIVSNFKEIRLYNKSLGPTRYESWQLTELNDTEKEFELQRFFFLLQNRRLFWEQGVSFVDKILIDRQEEELNISHKFYLEYKNHRVRLLNHLKKHNSQINELTLFEKTQKLLDRIIFICFCEDYDIIPLRTFNRLITLSRSNIFDPSESKLYGYVKHLFQNVNEGHQKSNINRFNGGLFADDPLLNQLIIKDDCLEPIVLMSRYDFATDMNVNILGHIFEQSISDIEVFKTQIIGETPDNQGKRKEDGIFYTPEYITRYIVEQAVGGWLNERKIELGEADLPDLSDEDYDSLKAPSGGNEHIQTHIRFWQQYAEALRNIKVIDPACGSGAFLNQVFDFLLKEHQILRNELDKLSLETDSTPLDKYILTNNIYGVDINHESVQITKLSLWLKTANKHSELTVLDQNILIGNSLIDDTKIAGDLAFKWEERFESIFENGGFDVVVGNPPYVNIYNMEKSNRDFFNESNDYKFTYLKYDLYVLFVEKGLGILKANGKLGYIIPSVILSVPYGTQLRKIIAHNYEINDIVDFTGFMVFKDAMVESCILSISKKHPSENQFITIKKPRFDVLDFIENETIIFQKQFLETESYQFRLDLDENSIGIIKKVKENSITIGNVYYVSKGIVAYSKIDNRKKSDFLFYEKDDDSYKPYLEGKDVNRYLVDFKGKYLQYDQEIMSRPTFPELHQKGKIIVRAISDGLNCTVDFDSHFIDQKLIICSNRNIIEKYISPAKRPKTTLYESSDVISEYAVAALMNSKLSRFYYVKMLKGGVSILPEDIRNFPLLNYSPEYENLGTLSQKLIELHNKVHQKSTRFLRRLRSNFEQIDKVSKKLSRFWEYDFKTLLAELKKQKVPKLSLSDQDEWEEYFDQYKTEIQALQAEIDRTDAEIDRMVYTLYDLTDEEIKIVEKS